MRCEALAGRRIARRMPECGLGPGTGSRLAVKDWVAAVAAVCRVRVPELWGESREWQVMFARHTLCWLLVRDGYSCRHVGAVLGRNHGTVIHSVRVVAGWIDNPTSEFARLGEYLDKVRRLAESMEPGIGKEEA